MREEWFYSCAGAGPIKVVASDGFNTGAGLSIDSVVLQTKAPDVYIASPADGYAVPEGWPVVLQALGTDPEDGPLSGEAFQWVSSRDGFLGSGEQLIADHLQPGPHIITLSGTDSLGEYGVTSVTITVVPVSGEAALAETATPAAAPGTPTVVPAPTEPGKAGLPVWVWVGLGAAVLAAAGAVIRVIRRRR